MGKQLPPVRRCWVGRTLPRLRVAAGTGASPGGLVFLRWFWLDGTATRAAAFSMRVGSGVVHDGVYPLGVHRAGQDY